MIVLAGGSIGYFREGSSKSLIFSVLFSSVLLFAALSFSSAPMAAKSIAIATSALLAAVMCVRIVKTKGRSIPTIVIGGAAMVYTAVIYMS